jgi:hypothetical protein
MPGLKKLATALIVFNLVAQILIFGLSQVSTKAIEEKIATALDSNTISITEYPQIKFRKTLIATVDNFSDCVEIGHARSHSGLSFSSRPSVMGGEGSPCLDLTQKWGGVDFEYSRFIHGSAAVIRIFAHVTSIETMKIVATVIIFLTLLVLIVSIWRKSTPLGLSVATYFFLLSDLPWQGLSLTHGIPTAISLITILAATQKNSLSSVNLGVLASLSGATYAVFAQLFTPLLFAALFSYFAIICRDSNSKREPESDVSMLFRLWVCGYFITMLVHSLMRFVLTTGDSASELQDGVSSRITQSLTGLIRVLYIQLVVNPSNYPMRFIGALILMLMFGYFLHGKLENGEKHGVNLKSFDTPVVYVSIWLLLMGGHNGHGWVGNLVWIVPVLIIFKMYISSISHSKDQGFN